MITDTIFIGLIILITGAILFILEAKIQKAQEELRTISYIVDYKKFIDLDGDISYYSILESLTVLAAMLLSACILRG